MVDRGQADFACPGRLGFGQGDITPKDAPVGRPAQVQFQLGLRCPRRDLIDGRKGGPTVFLCWRLRRWEFRLADPLALGIEPENPRQNASGRSRYLLGMEFTMKGIMLARYHCLAAHPPTAEHFAALACHPQSIPA